MSLKTKLKVLNQTVTPTQLELPQTLVNKSVAKNRESTLYIALTLLCLGPAWTKQHERFNSHRIILCKTKVIQMCGTANTVKSHFEVKRNLAVAITIFTFEPEISFKMEKPDLFYLECFHEGSRLHRWSKLSRDTSAGDAETSWMQQPKPYVRNLSELASDVIEGCTGFRSPSGKIGEDGDCGTSHLYPLLGSGTS